MNTVLRKFATGAGLGFVLASATMASAVEVSFKVNLSVQTALGTFDPATDSVYIAGDAINAWSTTESPLTVSPTDSAIWEGTFEVPGAEGLAVQYKFIKETAANGVVWEGNVGPDGSQNRVFTLASSAQVVPVVFFNNTSDPNVSSIPVTFQVDVSVQVAVGNFDPATGTVSVAGDPLNGWSTTASALEASPGNPNLWTGTFVVSSAPGGIVAYKFVLNGGTWENDGFGPGGGQNRAFPLSTAAQVLPVVAFNNANNLGALLIAAPSAGQTTISWTAAPLVRLQTRSNPTGGVWEDVPNTQGEASAEVGVGAGGGFFRLVAP